MEKLIFDGVDGEVGALETVVGELVESQRKANKLKLTTVDKVVEIASVGVCTHTNKIADPRVPVPCAINARYGRLGDINAGSVRLPSHRGDPFAYREIVLPGGSASIPDAKTLVTDYTLKDGDSERETNLLEAIMERRPAGEVVIKRGHGRGRSEARPHGLEKVVLVPESPDSVSNYIAMLPKMPAWLRPAASRAAHDFVIESINHALLGQIDDSIKAGKVKVSKKGEAKGLTVLSNPPRIPVVKINARFRKVLKPQNASLRFGTGREAGWVVQGIFSPPSPTPSRSLAKKSISKWAKAGAYQFSSVRDALMSSLNESLLFNAIAHQKHRQRGSYEIKNISVESTRRVRDAFIEYGEHAATVARELFSWIAANCGDEEISRVCSEILGNHEDPYGIAADTWNAVLKGIPDSYLTSSSSDDFLYGFSRAMWFYSDTAVDAEAAAPAGKPEGERSFQGRRELTSGHYLVISMDVSGHDAGSAGVTLGPPAPTAIYGFLHNIFERQAGLKIERFMPVIKKTVIRDELARRSGIYGALSAEAREAIANAAGNTCVDRVSDRVSAALAGNGAYFVGGHIVGCTASAISKKEVAEKPPFVYEVKADTRLTLVIYLSRPVEADSACIDGFVTAKIGDFDLSSAIRKTRLAGGQIRLTSVRAEMVEPENLRGFALASHIPAGDPLREMFQSVAFIDGKYTGKRPIGYLACGYEGVQAAPDVSRKGETFKSFHAETIYKAFSYCGANSPGRKWFKPKVGTSADNLFFFQLT